MCTSLFCDRAVIANGAEINYDLNARKFISHGLTGHWRICITSYLNTECSSSLARIISFCAILYCLSLMITYYSKENLSRLLP
jgi:hypothetical protein